MLLIQIKVNFSLPVEFVENLAVEQKSVVEAVLELQSSAKMNLKMLLVIQLVIREIHRYLYSAVVDLLY